jgi:hypothetical protein
MPSSPSLSKGTARQEVAKLGAEVTIAPKMKMKYEEKAPWTTQKGPTRLDFGYLRPKKKETQKVEKKESKVQTSPRHQELQVKAKPRQGNLTPMMNLVSG